MAIHTKAKDLLKRTDHTGVRKRFLFWFVLVFFGFVCLVFFLNREGFLCVVGFLHAQLEGEEEH